MHERRPGGERSNAASDPLSHPSRRGGPRGRRGIAAARGDRELAAARLREAADGWRARLAAPGRAGFIVDFGRPPVAGLVEPDRELARVEAELAALAGDTVAPA